MYSSSKYPLVDNIKLNSAITGMVPLDKLFDSNDVAQQPKMTPNVDEVEDCNIRTEQDPNMIKISNNLAHETKNKYISMLK